MSGALAEAPVIAVELKPKWATTTTTVVEGPVANISAATGVARRVDETVAFAVVPYARLSSGSLPLRAGKTVLFEGVLEQVGYFEDAIVTSTLATHFFAESSQTSLFACPPYAPIYDPLVGTEELLDWDAVVEIAPNRDSGSLGVTLEYTGRGAPKPFDNPWDD